MTDMMLVGFALLSMTLILLIGSVAILSDVLVKHKPFRMICMSFTMILMGIYLKVLAFIAGLA